MTSNRRTGRRRALAATVASATALGGAALLGPGTSGASSHRESPYLINDPAVDATDLYAFTSPDKDDTVTMVANYYPVQEPAGGPNFFPFATDARYNINIDNNGDARPDVIYRWTFKDIDRRGSAEHGDRGKGSILYNDGPVTSLDDPNLLFRQTYDLQVITNASGSGPESSTTVLRDVPVPPDYVGRASIPDYVPLRDAAVAAGRAGNGVSSFAGQRDDPFFLDLRIFDLLYGGDLSERGFNSLMGRNVNTLAIQVPKTQLAGSGDVTANPVVGVWTTSERRQIRVFKPTNALPETGPSRSSDQVDASGDWVQLSRLSTPLANEALIPANLKDYFNRSTPDRDRLVPAVLDKVQDPEIPHLIEQIYKIPNPNRTAQGANRPDLVAAFLTGISKKSYPPAGVDLNGLDLNANNAGVPSEMLRLNLTTPVTAQPNRLGVIGGDVGGFPNGRRLSDDVVDIELQALEGILIPDQDPATKRAVAGLGDAVDANDKAFLPTFPYVADPHSGSDTPAGAASMQSASPMSTVSAAPTASAGGAATGSPSGAATSSPINSPSGAPTSSPINSPSGAPTSSPAGSPRPTPTGMPIMTPTSMPIMTPTGTPIMTPTGTPIMTPTGAPPANPSPTVTAAPAGTQVTVRQVVVSRNGRATVTIRIVNRSAAGGSAQLYLVNPYGARDEIGSVRLNDTGVAVVKVVVPAKPGSRITVTSQVLSSGNTKVGLRQAAASTLTLR